MVPRDASQHGATLHHATQRNVPILYAPRCVTARRTTSPHNTTQGLLIMFKTNAEAARKIDLLCEALETLSPGETITYARLTKVAGEPITGGSHMLQRALKKTEAKTGSLFGNVFAKGYQRLQTKDIPGVGVKANTRIRRVARSTRKKFEGVRANDLTAHELAQFSAYRSHFGMLEGIARERSVEAMKVKLEDKPATVATMAERLDAMMKGKQRG